MADVKIRNLPDWVVGAFKSQAEQEGKSLEQKLRDLITAEAVKQRKELIEELAAFRKNLRDKYGELSNSTPGIRADRDRWG